MLEGWVLGLHLLSWHSAGDYPLQNPGVYVVLPSGYIGGVYKNSYKDTSFYFGKRWNVGGLDLTLAGVTGYERAKILPIVAVSKLWQISGDVGARLSAMPGAGKLVVHFSVEKTFD